MHGGVIMCICCQFAEMTGVCLLPSAAALHSMSTRCSSHAMHMRCAVHHEYNLFPGPASQRRAPKHYSLLRRKHLAFVNFHTML